MAEKTTEGKSVESNKSLTGEHWARFFNFVLSRVPGSHFCALPYIE